MSAPVSILNPLHAAPDLGAVICRRRLWLVPLVAMFVAMSATAVCIRAALYQQSIGNWGAVAIAAAIGLVFAAATLAAAARVFTKVTFHEHGVVCSSPMGSTSLGYEEVATLRYHLTRQFYNGLYAGAIVQLKATSTDGRKIALRVRYREKSHGFIRRSFESVDELDSIRDIISQHIAAKMTDTILAGITVRWAGAAEIGEHGITPLRGPCKRTLVPFGDIAGFQFDNGVMFVFARGRKRAILRISANTANYWPGMELLEHMVATARPAAAQAA
jgi:hypothetical protein